MLPDWLDDEKRMQDIVLSELDARTRELFETVQSCPDGLALLRFLLLNAQTLLTIEDVAFNLGLAFERVESCLSMLVDLGLVKRVQVVGVVLFGLTDSTDKRGSINRLVQWQERWQNRLERLGHIVEGTVPPQGRSTDHG